MILGTDRQPVKGFRFDVKHGCRLYGTCYHRVGEGKGRYKKLIFNVLKWGGMLQKIMLFQNYSPTRASEAKNSHPHVINIQSKELARVAAAAAFEERTTKCR